LNIRVVSEECPKHPLGYDDSNIGWKMAFVPKAFVLASRHDPASASGSNGTAHAVPLLEKQKDPGSVRPPLEQSGSVIA
jgi:hypothetical protein